MQGVVRGVRERGADNYCDRGAFFKKCTLTLVSVWTAKCEARRKVELREERATKLDLTLCPHRRCQDSSSLSGLQSTTSTGRGPQ